MNVLPRLDQNTGADRMVLAIIVVLVIVSVHLEMFVIGAHVLLEIVQMIVRVMAIVV